MPHSQRLGLLQSILGEDRYRSLMRRWVEARRRAGCAVPGVPTDVYLFKEDKRLRTLFPDAKQAAAGTPPKTSLVITFKDETASHAPWIASLEKQTTKPDELVLVDGSESPGLSPAERQRLEAAMSGRAVIHIHHPGCNIAAGRNFGAARSSGEILAFTDLGCTLDPEWLQRLIAPFGSDPACDLSAGWYEVVTRSSFSSCFSAYTVPRLEELEVERFIPSARSFAIRAELFNRLNGFPEYLTLAGEDSLFGYFAKFQIRRAAFVPEAIVRWEFPEGPRKIFRTVYGYSAGDAEGGRIAWRHYTDLVREAPRFAFTVLRYPQRGEGSRATNIAAVWILLSAQLFGFVAGYKRRREVTRRRIGAAKGIVFLISKQPITPANPELHAQFEQWRRMDYFVVNVYSLAGAAEVKASLVLEHQRLLSFLRGEFDLDRFLSAIGKDLTPAKEFVVVDQCRDAASQELKGKVLKELREWNVREA